MPPILVAHGFALEDPHGVALARAAGLSWVWAFDLSNHIQPEAVEAAGAWGEMGYPTPVFEALTDCFYRKDVEGLRSFMASALDIKEVYAQVMGKGAIYNMLARQYHHRAISSAQHWCREGLKIDPRAMEDLTGYAHPLRALVRAQPDNRLAAYAWVLHLLDNGNAQCVGPALGRRLIRALPERDQKAVLSAIVIPSEEKRVLNVLKQVWRASPSRVRQATWFSF